MVEACATALNLMGMLLSNHVARWVNYSETVLPRVTDEDPRGRNISLQFTPLAHKVFRAELVSTPPDGLDTLTRSSKVRKR